MVCDVMSLFHRIKALKRNALVASSLTPRNEAPSNVLADTVGMIVAAIAMVLPSPSMVLATSDSIASFT